MALHAATAAALAQPTVLMSLCMELRLPGYDLRLSDAGFYHFTWESEVRSFAASDPTYGTLGGVGPISDGVASDAPSIEVVLFPPTNAAMASLSSPEAQGSLLRVWVVVLDQVTGAVIGTPELWFKGNTDVPSVSIGERTDAVSITVNSVLFAAKQADEGARLNGGFHKRAWPGELGLDYSGNNQTDYWGAERSKPVIDYAAVQARMAYGLRGPA